MIENIRIIGLRGEPIVPVPSISRFVAIAPLSLFVAGRRAVAADGQSAGAYTGQTPPGRQGDCLTCHNQNSWSIERMNGGET
jgi:hypothetical protein